MPIGFEISGIGGSDAGNVDLNFVSVVFPKTETDKRLNRMKNPKIFLMFFCLLRQRVVLFLLFFMICFSSLAQGVRLFTAADGIPGSRFICLHQDAEGYIWLGNDGGLSRMVGSSMTTYHETSGKNKLKSNSINDLATDSIGQLWIGTSAGLHLFNHQTDEFFFLEPAHEYTLQEQNRQKAPSVSNITVLPDRNKILVNRGRSGLYVLDVRSKKVIQKDTEIFREVLKDIVCRRLFCDTKGRLWITTGQSLVLLDLKTMRRQPLSFDATSGLGKNNLEITQIVEDRKTRQIFLGDTKFGVLVYDEQSGQIRPFSKKPSRYKNVQCLLQLRNGTILVGCDRNGLARLNVEFNTIEAYNLSDPSFNLTESKIHGLMEDKWGNLYLLLYQKGLLVVPPSLGSFRFQGITNREIKQNSTAVSSMIRSKEGHLYVSTDGNGIFRGKDFGLMQRFSMPDDCNGNIYRLVTGKDGRMWIATYGSGLYCAVGNRVVSIPNQPGVTNRNVTSLSFDANQDQLFIGNSGTGLNVMNLTSGMMKKTSFCHTSVYVLYLAENNCLWIGGVECLMYDIKHKKVYRIGFNTKRNVVVYSFLELNGQMLIGTNLGLYLYDIKTQKTKHYTFPAKRNLSIVSLYKSQNNQVWIATNQGLIRFDPINGAFQSYSPYEVEKTGDFFPNAVLELTDGSLCFGGDNGVVVFNPMKMDKVFDKAEDIQLNMFYVDGESVTYESGVHDKYLDAAIYYATKITLPYNQNSFSIGFSSFNYAVSSAIEYKYRLDGFEEKWHSTSTDRPHAIYNQIPPGKYKLIIRSFNEHSNKVFSEKSIAVVVQSPWYWSFWSKLLYGVVFLALIVALFLVNQTRQKRKKRLRSLI